MKINTTRSADDSSSLLNTAILLAGILVLYAARDILVPLAFALTLTLILSPAVAFLQRIRFGRFPAVALVLVVTIGAAGGIGWVIFTQLVGVATELPQYRENIHHKIEAMRTPGKSAIGRATESVKELGKELATPAATPPPTTPAGRRPASTQPASPLPVQVVAPPDNELQYVRDLVMPFVRPLGTIGIILIITTFLLIKQSDLRDRLFRLAGVDRLNVMTQAIDDATGRVSRYLLMQFTVNLCFGTLCGIGLYIIGVPYAALWGAVAGLLRIVPYVGAVVAAALPITLSLAVFDTWTPPLMVFILFATMELITGNFLEPWLYGTHTGISPLALLLTTVVWTTLWGPAGLVLSTPLTVCVVILGRYVPQFGFLHVILGDEAVLEDDARLYQRLLAMDDQEAREVTEPYLEENSLAALYDSVIIPALARAEQDRHKGALDAEREEFLFLSVREMLAELSEKARQPEDEAEPVSQTGQGRVFVLPASDQADELTGAMLAQLLEQDGHPAIAFPLDTDLHNAIELMKPTEQDTFCVSALPPFAFASTIALNRRLRSRYPKCRILIGVWGFTGETERALLRFQPNRPHKLVTTLAAAVAFVAGVAEPAAAE